MVGKPGAERGAERIDALDREVVQHALADGQQQRHLLPQAERDELPLAERGADAAAVLDGLARAVVDHRAEAREDLEFEELGIVEPETLGQRLECGRFPPGQGGLLAASFLLRRTCVRLAKHSNSRGDSDGHLSCVTPAGGEMHDARSRLDCVCRLRER